MKTKNTILDVLRETLTPNIENMREKGEVVSGSRPCIVCKHPTTFSKGKSGAPLCAACLTLSAKMPCHSDPDKAPKNRGLSPCNPKGGGMGLLITQNEAGGSCHFFVREEKFDLVFLDTVAHTRIPFVTIDYVVSASATAAMDLEDGARYWWGLIQENDIYPTLEILRTAPWDMAQDTMLFRGGAGTSPYADTRASWRAVAAIKSRPEWVRMVKSVKRILEKDMQEDVRETKLAALPWHEHVDCEHFLYDINEHAMKAFF